MFSFEWLDFGVCFGGPRPRPVAWPRRRRSPQPAGVANAARDFGLLGVNSTVGHAFPFFGDGRSQEGRRTPRIAAPFCAHLCSIRPRPIRSPSGSIRGRLGVNPGCMRAPSEVHSAPGPTPESIPESIQGPSRIHPGSIQSPSKVHPRSIRGPSKVQLGSTQGSTRGGASKVHPWSIHGPSKALWSIRSSSCVIQSWAHITSRVHSGVRLGRSDGRSVGRPVGRSIGRARGRSAGGAGGRSRRGPAGAPHPRGRCVLETAAVRRCRHMAVPAGGRRRGRPDGPRRCPPAAR